MALTDKDREYLMNAMDRAYEQGHDEGYREGRRDGYKAGYNHALVFLWLAHLPSDDEVKVIN